MEMEKLEDDLEKCSKDLEKRLKDLEENLLKLKDADEKLDLNYSFDTEKYVYDPDSSLRAWEYYFKMYYEFLSNVEDEDKDFLFKKEEFGKKFWPSGNVYKRVVGTFCYFEKNKYIWPYKLDSRWFKKYKNIGIAGDCVFNFNEKKVPNFEKIIKKDNLNDQNTKEQIKVVLSLCSRMHYSPFNFSLMPTTGGGSALNNIKGRGKEDRIDVFLNKLKNIYDDLKELDESGIKKYDIEKCDIKKFDTYIQYMGEIGEIKVKGDLQKGLIHFLWCIGSFENYCKIFYQLDYKETKEKDLVERLLGNAEKYKSIENSDQLVKYKSIENSDQLVKYMELAVEYWEKQNEKYKKKPDTNKNQS